jgi:hypothetical protein
VLVRLSAGRYEATWDAFDPVQLIAVRWARFVVANCPFGRAEPTGAASHRRVLRFDKVLFNIILDNMLSNVRCGAVGRGGHTVGSLPSGAWLRRGL